MSDKQLKHPNLTMVATFAGASALFLAIGWAVEQMPMPGGQAAPAKSSIVETAKPSAF